MSGEFRDQDDAAHAKACDELRFERANQDILFEKEFRLLEEGKYSKQARRGMKS